MEQEYSTVPLYSLMLVKEKDIRYPVSNVPNDVVGSQAMRAYLKDKDCEHMAALMVNGRNDLIGMHLVAIGNISNVFGMYIRDIFKAAIIANASAIVLGHNHPSGDVLPSGQDIDFTRKAMRAGEMIGIPILDHLIVSSGINDNVFSFFAHGQLR